MPPRPLRFCDLCGGLDDHPRHVTDYHPDEEVAGKPDDEWLAGVDLSGAPIEAVQQLLSGNKRVRHMDCCAAQGCPTCLDTEAENSGLRGQELIDHLAEVRQTREMEQANG